MLHSALPSLRASLSSGWAGLGEFGWSIVFPSKDWGLMEKMICGPPQCVPKWHVVSLILISKMLDNSQRLCSSSPIQTLRDCQFSKPLFEQFTEELEGIRWSKNTVKFSENPRKFIGFFYHIKQKLQSVEKQYQSIKDNWTAILIKNNLIIIISWAHLEWKPE